MEFENKFWIRVLYDHLDFIIDSLVESEKDLINEAKNLRDHIFTLYILPQNYKLSNFEVLKDLTLKVRNYKLKILHLQLSNGVIINLSPTFVNHMLNEIDEYISIIDSYLSTDEIFIDSEHVHQHLMWLPDTKGHILSIMSSLDPIEKLQIQELKKMCKTFSGFYNKSIEFAGYLRAIDLNNTHLLKFFNEEVRSNINVFNLTLINLINLKLSNGILGKIGIKMLEHMIREELYYLVKLGYNIKIDVPAGFDQYLPI